MKVIAAARHGQTRQGKVGWCDFREIWLIGDRSEAKDAVVLSSECCNSRSEARGGMGTVGA